VLRVWGKTGAGKTGACHGGRNHAALSRRFQRGPNIRKPEYAKTTRFGRPIVHGLHLMALTALGAAPLAERLKASMIAFLEQEASFRKPVFKDDTLQPQFEVEGTEHRPGMEWGKLAIKVRLINQRDEIVAEGRHVYRILCRTPAR
jgi:3-hydroxybutyryl-CoA dehydratase